jgi:hypothetical protein
MSEGFIKITSKRGAYYCAGFTFGEKPIIYPVSELDGKLNQLCYDPGLTVEFVQDIEKEVKDGAVLSKSLQPKKESAKPKKSVDPAFVKVTNSSKKPYSCARKSFPPGVSEFPITELDGKLGKLIADPKLKLEFIPKKSSQSSEKK